MTDEPEVWAACPACATFTEKNSEEEAENLAESHNETAHDGEEVARAMAATKGAVNKLEKDAREVATPEQHRRLQRKLIQQKPFGVL